MNEPECGEVLARLSSTAESGRTDGVAEFFLKLAEELEETMSGETTPGREASDKNSPLRHFRRERGNVTSTSARLLLRLGRLLLALQGRQQCGLRRRLRARGREISTEEV